MSQIDYLKISTWFLLNMRFLWAEIPGYPSTWTQQSWGLGCYITYVCALVIEVDKSTKLHPDTGLKVKLKVTSMWDSIYRIQPLPRRWQNFQQLTLNEEKPKVCLPLFLWMKNYSLISVYLLLFTSSGQLFPELSLGVATFRPATPPRNLGTFETGVSAQILCVFLVVRRS